ncbi:RNA pseudouridylate synthase domain-containing protein 2 isoform X2 [Syngnathoides biaculeatus]|uniref:RNA pseudouridylate synthase domain-containing protein 2 isoform X2 n=1 Tax=Syngnathoides biaculeatus TaxID=300417 RepID=UPI002ADDDCBF|nr:RNA pseudouridylate synthase domain-containing protein 2 isoform X2 [Syngnathoides biaculeatus]
MTSHFCDRSIRRTSAMHAGRTVIAFGKFTSHLSFLLGLEATRHSVNKSIYVLHSIVLWNFRKSCQRGRNKHSVEKLLPGHRSRKKQQLNATVRSLSSMELAAATQVKKGSPVSAEGIALGDSKVTGKRKNDEPSGSAKRSRGARGKKLRPGERYVPPPQKRNPGVSFSQEHFDETSYYFEDGLRKVRPYYFDFKTYCKGRWVGKSLLEVFESEFRAESIEYYQSAVKEGRIRLNETPVEDLSVVLKNNDHIKNTVHRHEPPVVAKPLEVLLDDGEVLVVDKPASIPVHPCGRFRHNTVIFILGKERGLSELHTVHRLDRLTSGVLLFARTLEVSKKLDQLVRDRKLEKEYVCRVEGEFPEGELVCEEPILVVSFKIGLCRVDPKGKECRTVFQRLSFNGKSSVVRCLPLTGRTHQIRVHLQYLGFPILRDPIYGASAWGPHRGKGALVGKSDEELLKALVEEHQAQESLHLLDGSDNGTILSQEGQKDNKLQDGSCKAETRDESILQGTVKINHRETECRRQQTPCVVSAN